ncbi:spore germination protein [Alteribacillus sp. YIM 98480]|uniref:spore germination protein n=1 Tax=Alteribacillus sp. YIM 98480 TaxID=2606599 RepID=UPI00131CBE31|nr:spore germination protein [Alteribacillus sp. YIM 98480]
MRRLVKGIERKVLENKKDNLEKENGSQKVRGYLDRDLIRNTDTIKAALQDSSDIVTRSFTLFDSPVQAVIMYLDALVDPEEIRDHILTPLLLEAPLDEKSMGNEGKDFLKLIKNKIPTNGRLEGTSSIDKVLEQLLIGKTILLIQESKEGIIIDTTSIAARNIEEPIQESLIRGPRDGFTEEFKKNLGLIRTKMKSPSLTIKATEKGERTKKKVAVIYDESLARREIVEEVQYRLSTIQIDDLPDSGFIEQLIEDNTLSVFPQVQSTERPDKVVAALLEGRIAIILEGTPFALIVPVTLSQLVHSPEDYYERWYIGSFLRVLRYLSVFIAVFLPATYVSLTSYHQGLLPTDLALSFAGAREGIPFPSFIEALLMEVTLELLREAGVRLPKPLGQTVGIIGGIVIGEAAVTAGIVNPLMVIVVAMTAVSNFVIPSYSLAISLRILRFVVLLFAVVLGMYGMILFFILLMTHLLSLKSFGIHYFTPFSPFTKYDWRDFILRMPIQVLIRRPMVFHPKDKVKLSNKETD